MTAVTLTAHGCINIRNFVPKRKIFNWQSTLDMQTHYKERETFQYTNFKRFIHQAQIKNPYKEKRCTS